MRPVQPAAGEEANLAGFVDVRLDAIAIQLQLMDPVLSHRRRGCFRGQLRRNKRRQSFLLSRQLGRGERGHARFALILCRAGGLRPIRLPHMIPVTGNGLHVAVG